MTAKTRSLKAINKGILRISILLVLTSIANGEIISKAAQSREFPQGKGSLSGHITDAQTGRPVIDATVKVQDIFSAATDSSGFYLIEGLPAGQNFRISVDSNEYVGINGYQPMPDVRIQKDTQTVKDFKLDKACMIQVQVVDEANQPIEGAELSVRPYDNEIQRKLMQGGPRRYIQTNKDGIALLGGLIPSKVGYLIIAAHSESLSKDGTKTSTRQQDYAPGKLIAILNNTEYLESGQIVLQKGEDVTGRAVYADGKPASDLTVSVSRSYTYGNLGRSYGYGSYPIDAGGNFTLRHIVPGSYYISVVKQPEKGSTVTIADMRTDLPLADKGVLTINIPMNSSQPLVSIRGKLIFTSNNIPDSVYISASSVTGNHYSQADWRKPEKDACDMNFVVDQLVPEKYNLIFSSSYIKQKTVNNVDAPSEDLKVELDAFERFLISGTVINSQTGEPIQSFKALVKQVKPLSGTYNSQPAGGWQDMSYKDGSFCLEALGAGIYQIQIAADGFAQAASEEIDTSQNVPVVIKLSRGGTIKGVIVNEAGQPVDGVKVVPMSKMREATPYTGVSFSEQDAAVTVNGAFELSNITAGVESVKAFYSDYPPSIVDNIEVKEGQTTEGVKIVLSKGGTVEGYVYDAAGQPQSGNILIFKKSPGYNNWMEERSWQLATATTDTSGYYRAEGLPEQICYVSPQRERNAEGVICRAFVPARGKVSRYDFGGQPVIKGRAVLDGKPLANYPLDLTTTQRSYSAVFQCYAKTGANGEFTFGGVPKGKWSIYCADPKNKSRQLKIATIDADGHDIDTGVIPGGLSTLAVSIKYEQGEASWDVTDVYLREENLSWDRPLVMLEKPAGNRESFIARNIMPGRYRLVVNRGYVTQQRTIDITESNVNIMVQIPKGTAGVRGRLTRQNSWQILWREGKEVVCYITADANGSYKFNNLPAGKYYLSPDCSTTSKTLLEFEMAEGEQKELDMDTTNLRKSQDGILHVFVLDEYGMPVTGADIRLEGNGNTIEPITDSTPGFYFTAEPGKYTLYAKYAGYKETIQPAEVKNWDSQTMKRPPDPVFIRLEK
jgi:hypothetical protein